jgi:hypothetical protein
LDGLHDLATAPIKAVEGALAPKPPSVPKAKAAASQAKATAVQVLTKAPEKVVAAKGALASDKKKAVTKPLHFVMPPQPPPTATSDILQALMFVREFFDPVVDSLGREISQNTVRIAGLSDHVGEVSQELLGRIVFVESTLTQTIESYITKALAPLEQSSLSFAKEMAGYVVDHDPNVSLLDRANMKSMFDKVGNAAEFMKAWNTYKMQTSSFWARIKAGAPQWLSGLVLTGIIDSQNLSTSRNVRLEAVIGAFIALLQGNDRPAWLEAGAVPVMTLLSTFFGIPSSMTCSCEIQSSSFAGGITTLEAKITGVPDLLVAGNSPLDIVDARIETGLTSVRVTPTSSTSFKASDYVAGKTFTGTVRVAPFTVMGDTATDARLVIRFRGSEAQGYQRISTAISGAKALIIS